MGVAGLLTLGVKLMALTILGLVAHFVLSCAYNVLFHPLRKYPGPLAWRASRLPFVKAKFQGTLALSMLDLFNEYGPVVRIAPNELAYADAAAWKDIAGHNPKGEENAKWDPFYRPTDDMPHDIISADRHSHGVLRRQLAHGFSDRSMREQEPIIKGYVDLLMMRLKEKCNGGKDALDMAQWFNFTTFDIIGDLAFGESFHCLEQSNWHSWPKAIFELNRLGNTMQCASHYPWFTKTLIGMIPKSAMKNHENHGAFTHNRVAKRQELGKTRHDLIEGLLMKQDELRLPQRDLESNASLLIIAGSETTATLLSGVTFLLLTNPACLARLTHEVRSTFTSEDQITIAAACGLSYMLACLDEALRIYPPIANGLPRVVAKGGKTICGRYVPENSHVGVWQWAATHYKDNFVEAFSYRPERWLDGENEKYAADRREAMQPFSFGPRNCIGRNLAYAEMRTIMARLVFNFDLKLAEGMEDWMSSQKVYSMWQKPPLKVHLTPRA